MASRAAGTSCLVWAGLRGAVSLAAALSLPLGLPDRDLLLTLTLGIVLFTLLAQGLTMRPLLTWLGVVRKDTCAARDRSGGGAYAGDAGGGARGGRAAGDGALDPVVAERLIAGYAARREEIARRSTAAYGGSETLERQEERAAARHLLQVQREAARAAAAQGQIAEDTLGVCSRRSIRIWRASSKRFRRMGRDKGRSTAAVINGSSPR